MTNILLKVLMAACGHGSPKGGMPTLSIARALLLSGAMVLNGCAMSSAVVDHSFEFDARADSPDVEILDYRYGESLNPGASNPDVFKRKGEAPQGIRISGPMKVGDRLYVKWRIRETGAIYEHTADLKKRLSIDVTNQRIYFLIKGSQLHVFAIPRDDKRRQPHAPAIGPAKYRYLDVVSIYP